MANPACDVSKITVNEIENESKMAEGPSIQISGI